MGFEVVLSGLLAQQPNGVSHLSVFPGLEQPPNSLVRSAFSGIRGSTRLTSIVDTTITPGTPDAPHAAAALPIREGGTYHEKGTSGRDGSPGQLRGNCFRTGEIGNSQSRAERSAFAFPV